MIPGIVARGKQVAAGITYVGVASVGFRTTGTRALAMPAGLQEGDFLVVLVGCPNLSNKDVALASGYTEQGDYYIQSSDGFYGTNLGVFTKFAGASEPSATVTGMSTQEMTIAVVAAFRGVDPVTPLDVAVATSSTNSLAGIQTPSITPVTPGAVMIGGGACGSFYITGTGSVVSTPLAPVGWNAIAAGQDNASGRVSALGIAYKAWSGSGAESAANFRSVYTSGDSRSRYGVALALRPA